MKGLKERCPAMEHMEKREKNRRRKRRNLAPGLVMLVLVLAAALLVVRPGGRITVRELAKLEVPDYVDVQLIAVDGDSRRGTELTAISDIVIHYVGNPGTTASQNRGWYENPLSTVSSHFLVGLEGEVIQCLPLNEKSSATSHRNGDTISIEVCHPDDTGRFNEATYDALVELTAWLVASCGLDTDHVIRHYDATGKECPRYFVHNEDAWLAFKADVAARMD